MKEVILGLAAIVLLVTVMRGVNFWERQGDDVQKTTAQLSRIPGKL